MNPVSPVTSKRLFNFALEVVVEMKQPTRQIVHNGFFRIPARTRGNYSSESFRERQMFDDK
jgi:hypothetical protein